MCEPALQPLATPFSRCPPSLLPFHSLQASAQLSNPSWQCLDELANGTLDTCIRTCQLLSTSSALPGTPVTTVVSTDAACHLVSGCLQLLMYFPATHAKQRARTWQRALTTDGSRALWEASKARLLDSSSQVEVPEHLRGEAPLAPLLTAGSSEVRRVVSEACWPVCRTVHAAACLLTCRAC